MTKTTKAPGKNHREGIGLFELMEMFPTEESARQWFESIIWPNGPVCPHCGSDKASVCKDQKPMPYRCRTCRKHFSVRNGTILAESPLPLRKWLLAIYLCSTNLKSVSSMKLHRDLGVTQKTAWFLAHRIREAFPFNDGLYEGPVEVDETYIGGKRKNMPNHKRDQMEGRGPHGKTAVVGIKDRDTNKITAKVTEETTARELQGFIMENVSDDATVYTDEAKAYEGLPMKHESVKHSVGEYVRDQAHTNGMESFWSMLKRGYHGTFHHFTKQHMDRYIREFAGRHNVRELDTKDIMTHLVAGMIGKRLTYRRLINE